MFCDVCGIVDDRYDEEADVFHTSTPKHICNAILAEYKHDKSQYMKNKDGVVISCDVVIRSGKAKKKSDKAPPKNSVAPKIMISVRPNQQVKFYFHIENEMRNDDLLIIGVQLGHPQPQFKMNDHPFIFGGNPHILEKKSSVKEEVSVLFVTTDIGQHEMPIMFTLYNRNNQKNLIFIREMIVTVVEEEDENKYIKVKSPYKNKIWEHADNFIMSPSHIPQENKYKVPKLLKILFPKGLNEDSLEKMEGFSDEMKMQLRSVLITTRSIMNEGITEDNYAAYFHHLLWWEETIATINIRKYNMAGVKIVKNKDLYFLEVPGLAEKRPSLLRGDRVFIRPVDNNKVIFESIVKNMEENTLQIGEIHESFEVYYSEEAVFDIRFIMSRMPMERMHEAVNRLTASKQLRRVFPNPSRKQVALKTISKFYNPLIKLNAEQRCAVEHILSKTSGRAPYIVFGPPGTGKTMTIVEAIIQIVVQSPINRVLVCTDSNMAADHIALMLLRYNKHLNINNFILRANSQSRDWVSMPSELEPVSNGKNFETWFTVGNNSAAKYRILVTTLLHSAKYTSAKSQTIHKLRMTHVFIDEAAQASEPAALVPITGLLEENGQLVLAGDPKQLGPVCMSKEAKQRGLGTSLLERLKLTYDNLYDGNPNYITMLVKNFRSDPDILKIPNELFYNNELQALAKPDPLSKISILGQPGGERAIIFHAVPSREQKMGKSPSYFNEMELNMLKRYIQALIKEHQVLPKDIGVIAPYIRQVYKMKGWLTEQKYDDIEVGTVESFQGKEKRVILVSTVRANCRLLDFDAKYDLGFLVDDKRYNVALTRAQAKLIIIGNPTCLVRDIKWTEYMNVCTKYNCYFGSETQQLDRNSALLIEVAKTRFQKCRLYEVLDEARKTKNKNKEHGFN